MANIGSLKFRLQKYIPNKLLRVYYNSRHKQKHYAKSILSFETHLVEHCNLNCKCCCHFSCLAEKEFVDVSKFSQDIARLSYLFDKQAAAINLLGGEPLLHPQLPEILAIVREYFPATKISLLTNGLLLLRQPSDFWAACRKCNIIILVTKYPVDFDWEMVDKTAGKENARLTYGGKWAVKTMHCLPLDLNGQQDQETSFARCNQGNDCITLYGGKLFTCPTAAHIRHFNKFFKQNLIVGPNDYIDIYENHDGKEILQFLSQSIPFCKYCDFNNKTTGIKWGISAKDMAEWI